MNLSIKVKGEIMVDGCYEISVASIGNGFVEVYQTERKVVLVRFYDIMPKECITV